MARQADAIYDALAGQPVTPLDRDPLAVRQDVLRAELVRTGQAVALNLIAAEAIGGVGDERRRGDIAPAILGLAAGERALVAGELRLRTARFAIAEHRIELRAFEPQVEFAHRCGVRSEATTPGLQSL